MQKGMVALAAASLAMACLWAQGANAEIAISGNADSLVLQARNANLGEIVLGLRSALRIEIELAGSDNRQITGTYSGTLRRVLARLLGGSDYVVKPMGKGIRVAIVGGTAQRAAPARAALAAAAAGQGGSRESRLRQQRMVMRPPMAQDSY